MATTKKTASKPAKKAVPAKAAAKKTAPAKKTVATKKAAPAPVKKAAAKKVAPVKAAPTKAAPKKATPAKTAAPKKAAPKKAAPKPAPKAPAKKVAPAPVKAAAKKAPAKVAPAKTAPVKAAAKKTAPAKKEIQKKEPIKAVPVKDMTDKKPATKATTKSEAPAKTKVAPAAKPVAAKAAPKRKPLPVPPPAPKSDIRDAVRSKPRIEMSKPGVIAHRKLEKKEDKQEVQPGLTMKEYNPTKRSLLDEPQQNTGPVYRYSDEELNEFKELISKRLESARENLSYYQALITRKDEAGTDDTDNRFNHLEDGSGAMEREQLSQLAGRQIQFINHLEKALIRIENKTYGICRVTGKLIDKARLRAVPHATLSIEAKNTMNK